MGTVSSPTSPPSAPPLHKTVWKRNRVLRPTSSWGCPYGEGSPPPTPASSPMMAVLWTVSGLTTWDGTRRPASQQ